MNSRVEGVRGFLCYLIRRMNLLILVNVLTRGSARAQWGEYGGDDDDDGGDGDQRVRIHHVHGWVEQRQVRWQQQRERMQWKVLFEPFFSNKM